MALSSSHIPWKGARGWIMLSLRILHIGSDQGVAVSILTDSEVSGGTSILKSITSKTARCWHWWLPSLAIYDFWLDWTAGPVCNLGVECDVRVVPFEPKILEQLNNPDIYLKLSQTFSQAHTWTDAKRHGKVRTGQNSTVCRPKPSFRFKYFWLWNILWHHAGYCVNSNDGVGWDVVPG